MCKGEQRESGERVCVVEWEEAECALHDECVHRMRLVLGLCVYCF